MSDPQTMRKTIKLIESLDRLVEDNTEWNSQSYPDGVITYSTSFDNIDIIVDYKLLDDDTSEYSMSYTIRGRNARNAKVMLKATKEILNQFESWIEDKQPDNVSLIKDPNIALNGLRIQRIAQANGYTFSKQYDKFVLSKSM